MRADFSAPRRPPSHPDARSCRRGCCTRSTAKRRNFSDGAPRHCGSLGGKCTPISPSASAPRMASTNACRGATSASECPDEAVRVRDSDAAQHDVIALGEGVYVVAGGHAHIRQRARTHAFSTKEIVRHRQLHVTRLTSKDSDRMAGPLQQPRVVGKIIAPLSGRLPMRGEQRVEIERLRRLNSAQCRSGRASA